MHEGALFSLVLKKGTTQAPHEPHQTELAARVESTAVGEEGFLRSFDLGTGALRKSTLDTGALCKTRLNTGLPGKNQLDMGTAAQ